MSVAVVVALISAVPATIAALGAWRNSSKTRGENRRQHSGVECALAELTKSVDNVRDVTTETQGHVLAARKILDKHEERLDHVDEVLAQIPTPEEAHP